MQIYEDPRLYNNGTFNFGGEIAIEMYAPKSEWVNIECSLMHLSIENK